MGWSKRHDSWKERFASRRSVKKCKGKGVKWLFDAVRELAIALLRIAISEPIYPGQSVFYVRRLLSGGERMEVGIVGEGLEGWRSLSGNS
ncbi:MAG: hypothetical protein F6K32_13695 [Desertifilum sp. SIO1I2]|nr:hypothetical protein [Desertifilum sp. SIO1I2]